MSTTANPPPGTVPVALITIHRIREALQIISLSSEQHLHPENRKIRHEVRFINGLLAYTVRLASARGAALG